VFPSDLPGVNPATLNEIFLYYRLMTKWSGLGDSTELSQVGLSQTVTPPTTSRNQLWLVNFSNNHRGSIADRHCFINSLPKQQRLSHLFKWLLFSFLGLFSSSCRTTCRLLICVCFSTGFHGSYTLLTTLGVYQSSHHESTSSTQGLSLGGSF
jgi:hypothetical protein